MRDIEQEQKNSGEGAGEVFYVLSIELCNISKHLNIGIE